MSDEDEKSVVAAGATVDRVAVEASPADERASDPVPTIDGEEQSLEGHRLRQQVSLSEFGLHALQLNHLPQILQSATEMCAKGMSVRLCKALRCGSAWKRDPGSGVIGVEKGPLIPVV